jgi:hypothetical protein
VQAASDRMRAQLAIETPLATESSYRDHIDAPMIADLCLKFAQDTCGNQ